MQLGFDQFCYLCSEVCPLHPFASAGSGIFQAPGLQLEQAVRLQAHAERSPGT